MTDTTTTNQTSNKQDSLNEPFHLFYLKDLPSKAYDWHYHEFHKMILFLSGNVNYIIEGKSYPLEPGDFVLIPRNDIHKPVIGESSVYERIILYSNLRISDPLASCFRHIKENGRHVLRFPTKQQNQLNLAVHKLLDAANAPAESFGYYSYNQALYTQLLIELYRNITESASPFMEPVVQDEKLSHILTYLNEHLAENINVESLSERFFISKYHLMHLFKEKTGYSIHHYLTVKRLFLAKNLLADGKSVAETALRCGYSDYSTFSRAFHGYAGLSPGDYKKSLSPPSEPLSY